MASILNDTENFIVGNINYLNRDNLPVHILQQVELRKMLCAPCLSNGKCLHCGCKTPNMFYSPSKVDSEGKFAEFLNANQWNALVNNIDTYYKFIKENVTTPEIQ